MYGSTGFDVGADVAQQVLGDDTMPPFNNRVMWRARASIEDEKIPVELQLEDFTSMWWFEGGSVRIDQRI